MTEQPTAAREGEVLEKDENAAPEAAGLFSDPVVAQTVADDPLARFLNESWKNLLVTVGVLVVAYLFYGWFSDAQLGRRQEAADRYTSAREEFDLYQDLVTRKKIAEAKKLDGVAADKKADAEKEKAKEIETTTAEIQKAKGRLTEKLRALADEAEPYPELGKLYEGLIARTEGDMVAAKAALSVEWKAVDGKSPQRFSAELSNLNLARLLIDQPDSVAQGKTILGDLATQGIYVQVAAAMALSKIAQTPEEITAAIERLEAVKQKSPKQAELVTPEIERLQAKR